MFDDYIVKGSVKSGLRFIDGMIGGSFSPALHVISGNAGSGKTALLLQTAANSEHPVVLLNTDMHQSDLRTRLITVVTGASKEDIVNSPKEQREKLVEITRGSLAHLKIEDGKSGFYSLGLLKDRVLEVKDTHNPDTVLVIIDSFNNWVDTAVNHSGRNKDEIVAEALANLIDFIQEYDITVLVSAQSTNEVVHRSVNDALLAQANTYISLSWERGGRPNSEGLLETRAYFEKNRDGQMKKSTFGKFNGKTQRFSD